MTEPKSTVRALGLVRGNGGCILLEQNAVGIWALPEARREKDERLAEALQRHVQQRYGVACDVRTDELRLVYESLTGTCEHLLLICYVADARDTRLNAHLGNFKWATTLELADLLKRNKVTHSAREAINHLRQTLQATGT